MKTITQDIFQPIPMAVFKGYTKLGTIYPKGWNGATEIVCKPTKDKYKKQLEKEAKRLYNN